MRRFLLRWWAESCLAVPLLTCGCQHNPPCPATCNAANAVMMGAPVAAPAGAAATGEAPAPGNVPAMPGSSQGPSGVPTAPSTAPNALPVIPTAGRSALATPADPMLSLAPPPFPAAAGSPPMPPSLPAAQPDNQASSPALKGEAAAPAGSHFGHDPSYHWLVGTIDYCRIQQAWVLRYVPVEEDDRYGGCVTLVTSNAKISFKAGQTVRVEGALIDPDSQQLRPAFQVESMRAD